MSWFFESRFIPSEKNGKIRCMRLFGRWSVIVDGYFETTPYTNAMWRKCLRRVPKKTPVKRVLLLGLGAGGSVALIRRRFPKSRIIAVEWDPEMVALAKTLKLYRAEHAPEIIQGDAGEVIKKLQGEFDLIIFDLYHGKEPSPLIKEEPFLREIDRLLSWNGYFLTNVFEEKKALLAVDRFFSRWSTIHFRFNTCASYRHFGRGRMGDRLPADYVQYRQDEACFVRESKVDKSIDGLVGESGRMGRSWHHGPLHFEGYLGDQEPKIEMGKGGRMVIWQPITRMDRPKGWMRSPAMMNTRQTGFAAIERPEAYWKNWSSHAQRHRQHWLKHKPYDIAEVPFEEFLQAYENVKMDWILKKLFIWLMGKKQKAHGERVHYLLAKTKDDKRPVAGFAFIDIPESRQSIHLISFIKTEAEKTSVGTGLMDAWFRYGVRTGLTYLDFDCFWYPGEPKSWRGFSRFKSQFGIHFIVYPNPLIKFVR